MNKIIEINGSVYIGEESEQELIVNLKNIKFESQQLYILQGHNGSGKSSAINSIFNHPDYKFKGSIKINGDIIPEENRMEILIKQHKIFYVIQHIQLVNEVTYEYLWEVMQNNFGFKFDWELIEQFTNLATEKKKYNIGSCSGGENKIMELIPFLSMPNLQGIILDEIDSSLDFNNIKLVNKIIQHFINKGSFVVLITHNLENWNNMQFQIIESKEGIIKHI